MNVKIGVKQLLSDSLYTFTSTAVSRFAFILVSLLSARYLNREDFQNLSILISTVNMLVASIGIAFGVNLLKKSVDYHSNREDKVAESNFMSLISLIVMFLCIIGLLSLFFIPFISEKLFIGDKVASLFMIASAITGVGSTVASYLIISLDNFRVLAKIKLVCSVIFIFCCVLLKYMTDRSLRFESIMSFYLGYFIILLSWYITTYRSYGWKIKLIRPSRSHQNGIIDISGPALLSNLSYAAVMWFQMIMIYQLSGDRQLASKIAVALTWYNALVFIPQILSSVLLPKLLKTKGIDFKTHMFRGGIINVISVAIAIVALLVFSNLIDNIYSQQFGSVSSLVLLMSLSAFPNALCKLTGQYFLVKDKMSLGFIFNLFWGGIYTAVNYFLIPYYSEYAVAYGLIISYMMLFFAQLIYFRRIER